jgi:hypothetical protein
MSLPLPHTPTRSKPSPYTFSPSPSAYLSYLCSSPTPLPSDDALVPTEISPHRYHLAHPGLTSTPRPSVIPLPAVSSTCDWSTANKPNMRDASSVLKPSFKTFSMLTAAETLLSVQLESPSPSACPSSLSSDAHAIQAFWNAGQAVTNQSLKGDLAEDEASVGGSQRSCMISASPSPLEQAASSSQQVPTSWHETRTPSRKVRHGQRVRSSYSYSKFTSISV